MFFLLTEQLINTPMSGSGPYLAGGLGVQAPDLSFTGKRKE